MGGSVPHGVHNPSGILTCLARPCSDVCDADVIVVGAVLRSFARGNLAGTIGFARYTNTIPPCFRASYSLTGCRQRNLPTDACVTKVVEVLDNARRTRHNDYR